MASFEVQIRRIEGIEPISGADRIEQAAVGGYRIVTQKNRFVNGDLAVYVPEAGVVPDKVLKLSGFWKECETCSGRGESRVTVEGEEMEELCSTCKGRRGTGMLAGSKGNRVKPIKLKGVVSEGILLDLDIFEQLGFEPVMQELYPHEDLEGKDVGAALGIEKYVVPIPANLAGKVYPLAGTIKTNSDPENVKKVQGVFQPNEPVVMAEKIHGTALISGLRDGELYVSSKGQAGKGLVLEDEKDEQGRSTNFYHRALQSIGGEQLLTEISEQFGDGGDVALYGEAYPAQDLKYGETGEQAKLAVFDIRIGDRFLKHDDFMDVCKELNIPNVPILYTGPYSDEALAEHTDGKEQLSGREVHIREGVVVKPLSGRYDDKNRRVIVKSISEDYLTRKNATEFN